MLYRPLILTTLLTTLIAPQLCPQTPTQPPNNSQQNPSTPNPLSASTYKLGPGDTFAVAVADLEEFNDKTFLVDMAGDATLPLAGRCHVANLSPAEVQTLIASRLTNIVKDPDVVVSFATFGSQPVSVLGAVSNPGMRQLEGKRTLYEVLSLAGGLRPDAGNTIHITRDLKWGPIPLPDAKNDSSGKFSVASVKVKDVMTATEPAENIAVKPNDVISIPRAEMVFAVGSVTKPGGFLLTENETISTLQVISLAEGLQKNAASNKAKIFRAVPGSANRLEIPVDVKQLMAGKTADIPLQPNDILFIPSSGAKAAAYRTLDVITAAAGFAIGRY